MKLNALDHPKTLNFAALLGVTLPTAIGHLELFWAFTAKFAPQGNVGKHPDGAISMACFWSGDPETFMSALLECRFVDASTTHRLIVHDWEDHAAGWVRAKLKKTGQAFISTGVPSSDPTPVRSSEPSSDPSLEPSIQAKPSQAKPSQAQEARATDFSARLQATYPDTDNPHDWFAGLKATEALISNGEATEAELLDSAARYRGYTDARKATGTQFVKAPHRYFARTRADAPAPWAQQWTPPPTKGEVAQEANIDASLTWLREQEARDAAAG